MRRTHRRPAPQKNIKPDAQVDERDQAQPIVHGAFGRNQHHFHIQRHRAADQRIGRLGIDPGVVELPRHRGRGIHRTAVDADDLVAPANASPFSRAALLQAIGDQLAVPLHPPRTVVGNRGLVFDSVVETGEQDRRYCEKRQQDGGKPSLKFTVHGLGRWCGVARYSTPLRHQQLHCHPPISPGTGKSLL